MNARQCIDISGIWRFTPDPHRDGESLGFWQADRAFPRWREARVPSCFEAGCPDIDFYQGLCWYRRAVTAPPAWQDRRIVLRFEAVNYRAKVWLNGELLGESRDGFLPFEFDVSARLRRDGENILAVAVDNAHYAGDVPGMHVGWRGYGGILREVRLIATSPVHLDQLRVLAAPRGDGGDVTARVRVCNTTSVAVDGVVEVAVEAPDGGTALSLRSPRLRVEAQAAAEVELQGHVAGARAWAPAHPVLYRAVARLAIEEQVTDAVAASFGFRTLAATPDGLLLNGERIFLTGFNRHEDSPRTAMATDLETTRRDLEQMKDAGANFVRLCHYPHHPAELDLCDALGLLAFCEIPLYFWHDAAEGLRTNAERVETASRQLARMIARDFNHPSVAFWSVSNETHEEEPEVQESNRALIRQARALDPSRLCVHVSNHWTYHPNFAEDDVVCINSYPTMDFEARGHHPAFDVDGAVARQRAAIDALHRQYPSKPVLICEFGASSFTGTFGQSFGEEVHARALEAEFATFDAPYLCGATIWCWADHPWPGARFFDGLTISPFGVVSRDRRRLAPYWTTQRMFRTRHGLPLPPRGDEPAGATVIMVRPHLRDLPTVPFPDGYGIRAMTVDDIGLWTDIQRDAEPSLTITDTLFRDAFGDDLAALGHRCFIVTDPRGLGVGTISAWYNREFRGQEYGRIHWLAVRPCCQGRGVGKAALSFALQQLAQWHARAYLVTSVERLAAIALYLQCGFVPDMTPRNARTAWQEVGSRLPHPAIAQALEA